MQLLPLPPDSLQWLHDRCITDAMIEMFKISYCEKGGKGWITFPVKKADGSVFYKLRAAPGSDAVNRYAYDPAGSSAELYGRGLLGLAQVERVVVCEGEFDAMLLIANNIAAVTSTSGVGTFKDEWVDLFPQNCHVILCFDHDESGEKGRKKVRHLFESRRPDCVLRDIRFTGDLQKGYDISDYFKDGGRPEGLLALATEEKEGAAQIRGGSNVPGGADYSSGVSGSESISAQNHDTDEPGSVEPEKHLRDRGTDSPSLQSGEDGGEEEEAQTFGKGKKRTFAQFKDPPEVTVEAWKATIKEHFPKLTDTAEICASVVTQLLITDVHNPFSLFLTDRPGSGKTITLNFFRGLKELTYFTSDFTPASFVTSIAGRTPKQLEEIDLLPKIRWKTLLVKDLAPLLSDNDDVLRKHLGMLTDILDGEGFTKESGVHGSRGYEGDYLFMFLAATTPLTGRVWKLMTGMGHRFFFLGLESKRKKIDELREQLQGGNFKEKENACKDMTHDFMRTIWSRHPEGVVWNTEMDDEETVTNICRISDFLSLFRGDIYVNEEKWTDGRVLGHSEPKIEDASRINQCLYNLCRGHALLYGRTSLTADDLWVAVRVALDTAPNPRPRLFRELLKKDGQMTVGDVAAALGMSVNTAKKEIHKLCALGICDSELAKQAEENEFGAVVDFSGQNKTTMTLKEEFGFWLDMIITQSKNKQDDLLKE